MELYKVKKFLIVSALCIINTIAKADTLIEKIAVEGNKRIEAQEIKSYLDIKPGQKIKPDDIDRNLKKLYAIGHFTDVSLSIRDHTLVASVVENPSINQISFEGNKNVADTLLEKEVKLEPRMLLTKSKVQYEVQRILAIYRQKGYFNAKVSPKIIKKEQNRVDVVFEIEEGKIAEIRKIKFIGNTKFDDDKLRSILITKESHWWRFFSSDDFYDPDRLEVDRENYVNFI